MGDVIDFDLGSNSTLFLVGLCKNNNCPILKMFLFWLSRLSYDVIFLVEMFKYCKHYKSFNRSLQCPAITRTGRIKEHHSGRNCTNGTR